LRSNSLEVVVLHKLLQLLDVADGEQILLDVRQRHQGVWRGRRGGKRSLGHSVWRIIEEEDDL